MQQEHKDQIRKNFSALLKMNFNQMYSKLVEHKVFTQVFVDYYKRMDEDGKWQCVMALDTTGPEGFDKIIRCLRETNQNILANKLLGIPDSFQDDTIRNNMISLQEPPQNYRTEPEHIEINVQITDEFHDNFTSIIKPYTMRSFHRGAVLIINNTKFNDEPERRGAHVDQQNLIELFHQMGGYDLTVVEDVSDEKLKEAVIKFTKNDHLKLVNVAFVFIMSHGNEIRNESQVKCVNGFSVSTTWIESQFCRDNCPYLQNKPKVIVYQICRGVSEDNVFKLMENFKINDKETETDGTPNIPVRKHSDMLVCHSTAQGYKAHRHTSKGSWYIQSICKVFMMQAHSYHVVDLMHMVDKELSTWQSENYRTMQTTGFYNLGFRHCYLNPGIYEEGGELYRYPPRR